MKEDTVSESLRLRLEIARIIEPNAWLVPDECVLTAMITRKAFAADVRKASLRKADEILALKVSAQ